ncbi:MAG TPA: RNA polymerase sigma-70 factor [Ignavibacteria bacterium]|nr:RNA polymerase sigma-70 factor [Ignavibacteria bacterium]
MVSENVNTDPIKLLKKGNMLAFDSIYNKYSKRLYGFVLRFIKNEADAEEIIQEVFLKIWEGKEKIDPRASFESYLFTVSYNTTMSLLRKRANEVKYVEFIKYRQHVLNENEIIDDIHYKELTIKLNELLNQLTPRQKEIFLLSRKEGLTHNEIAQKLNISSNTVKNHFISILKFLKSGLSKDFFTGLLFIYLFL